MIYILTTPVRAALYLYRNYIPPEWYAKQGFEFTKYLWYKYSPLSKVPKDFRVWMRWSISRKLKRQLFVGGFQSLGMISVRHAVTNKSEVITFSTDGFTLDVVGDDKTVYKYQAER